MATEPMRVRAELIRKMSCKSTAQFPPETGRAQYNRPVYSYVIALQSVSQYLYFFKGDLPIPVFCAGIRHRRNDCLNRACFTGPNDRCKTVPSGHFSHSYIPGV